MKWLHPGIQSLPHRPPWRVQLSSPDLNSNYCRDSRTQKDMHSLLRWCRSLGKVQCTCPTHHTFWTKLNRKKYYLKHSTQKNVNHQISLSQYRGTNEFTNEFTLGCTHHEWVYVGLYTSWMSLHWVVHIMNEFTLGCTHHEWVYIGLYTSWMSLRGLYTP